jgi:hypothetical protein
MIIPFTQVDAFTARPHAGNPAAVMPLDAWLPDDVLQAIAAENNLSETAFTVPAEATPTTHSLVHPDDRDRDVRPCHACGRPCPDDRATASASKRAKAGVLTVARTSGKRRARARPARITGRCARSMQGLLAALGLAAAPVLLSTTKGRTRRSSSCPTKPRSGPAPPT